MYRPLVKRVFDTDVQFEHRKKLVLHWADTDQKQTASSTLLKHPVPNYM